MDGILQPPAATAFDAAASVASLLVYLGVAVIVLVRAPRDSRAQVFLVVALCSAVPYALSPLQWSMGNAVYTPAVIAATSVAFALGSIALFHFTQVFPRRRPWIGAYRFWLAAAYVLLPIPVAAIAWVIGSLVGGVADTGSGGLGAVSVGVGEGAGIALLLMIPVIFVVGLVLPFGGVMSLFKSWQEAKRDGDVPARSATFWILMSQMGGGVLSVLVLPLLHVAGVGAPWSLLIAALAYAFALLLPLAYIRYATISNRA
jgi:hypothetical protein